MRSTSTTPTSPNMPEPFLVKRRNQAGRAAPTALLTGADDCTDNCRPPSDGLDVPWRFGPGCRSQEKGAADGRARRIELLQLDYFGLEGAERLSVGADIFSGPILTTLRDSCSPMAEERGPPSQPSPLSPSSDAAARLRAQYGSTASSSGRRVGRSASRYSVRTVNPVLRRDLPIGLVPCLTAGDFGSELLIFVDLEFVTIVDMSDDSELD